MPLRFLRAPAVLSALCAATLVSAQTPAPEAVDGPGSAISLAPRPHVVRVRKLPYGLPLMARFDLLPQLRDTKCVMDSSYDRSGGNGDADHFFKREGNKTTLADIRGPGCIYRFWSANAAGHLRIFFDDDTTPRIDCPMQDLFLGKVAPFIAPLVGHKSGGWYCFFPMPFQKHCRIEVTDPGGLYYHVQYQLYPDDAKIRTFTVQLTNDDKKALDTIVDQWSKFGSDPKPPMRKSLDAAGQGSLAAGQTTTLATLNGPAEVTAVRLKIAPADRFTLRQAVLRVYWDGATKPAIEAPVGDFFGVGFGDNKFKALPTALTEDGGVCYWPMPFNHSARFELQNTGKVDLSNIAWTITSAPKRRPLDNAGYFHAQWHRETTVSGKPFTILNVTGRGHYVGEHTDMQGDRGIGFLEGDEKVLVDGEKFPSIYGTGTEDFYTGGWYFDEGPFNAAYHGCTVKIDEMSRVAAYRYQIQDLIPFTKDLNMTIEHGGTNDYPGADYSCVAYWYQTVPEHDWSPVEVAQLTPAVMRIGGVLEAEDLKWTAGDRKVVDDRDMPTESSGGKVVVLGKGESTFQFDVKDDDVYTLGLTQPTAAGSVKIGARWWLDADRLDADLLKAPDESLQAGETHVASRTLRLKPGPHTLTLVGDEKRPLYLDYVRLNPSRKERGVIEAESLLDKADVGGKGAVAREDATYDWSGGSALIWKPSEQGATLKLPVSVGMDGDFSLELGITPQPDSPIIVAKIDDGAPMDPIDSYAAKIDGGKASVLYRGTNVLTLKKGDHTLTLTFQGKNAAVTSPALWLDYIALRKSRYPFSMEAESLRVLEAKDGEATHQDMKSFGADWSNDDQFWFRGEKQGSEATLELPVAKAGGYNLSAYYTTSRDYAVVQVLVDGKEVGAPTDTYTAPVVAKGKTALGKVDLTAGNHRLTFRAVGKNALSTGYFIGVDAVALEPVK